MSLIDHDFSFASGERYSTTSLDSVGLETRARYRFACEVLREMPGPLVGADIFCGGGYGAHMLAQSLPCFLLAIDGSAESIRAATEQYVDFNLLFSHKLFPFTLPREHFDFIVSIESIEHVEDGEMFFELLAGALKPGGKLIISTPNSEVVDLAKNPYRWHYRHYTAAELVVLGGRHGLTHQVCMGSDCIVIAPDGRVVANNFYSPSGSVLRRDYAGDTLVHLFEKPRGGGGHGD